MGEVILFRGGEEVRVEVEISHLGLVEQSPISLTQYPAPDTDSASFMREDFHGYAAWLEKQLAEKNAEIVELSNAKKEVEVYTKKKIKEFQDKLLPELQGYKNELIEKNNRIEELEMWEQAAQKMEEELFYSANNEFSSGLLKNHKHIRALKAENERKLDEVLGLQVEIKEAMSAREDRDRCLKEIEDNCKKLQDLWEENRKTLDEKDKLIAKLEGTHEFFNRCLKEMEVNYKKLLNSLETHWKKLEVHWKKLNMILRKKLQDSVEDNRKTLDEKDKWIAKLEGNHEIGNRRLKEMEDNCKKLQDLVEENRNTLDEKVALIAKLEGDRQVGICRLEEKEEHCKKLQHFVDDNRKQLNELIADSYCRLKEKEDNCKKILDKMFQDYSETMKNTSEKMARKNQRENDKRTRVLKGHIDYHEVMSAFLALIVGYTLFRGG